MIPTIRAAQSTVRVNGTVFWTVVVDMVGRTVGKVVENDG